VSSVDLSSNQFECTLVIADETVENVFDLISISELSRKL